MASPSNMPNPALAAYDFGPSYMLIILLVGLAGAVFTVVFRFAGRKVERLNWWWDDYFALLSLILFAGGFWTDYQIMFYSSKNPEPFLIYLYIVNILYPLVSGTTMISGLLLYVLHFGFEKWPRRIAYTLMAMVVLWSLATLGGTIVQCRSLAAAWSVEAARRPGPQCLNQSLFFEAISIANSALTFLILLLPITRIRTLELRTAGRVFSFVRIYLLGLFVLACSVLRAYYVTMFQPSPILSPSPMDTIHPFFFWTKLTESVGIQVICMPPAMPAFIALFRCSLERPKDRAWKKGSRRLNKRIVSDGYEGLIIGKEDERWAKEMGMQVLEVEGAAGTKSEKLRRFREEIDRDIAAKTGPRDYLSSRGSDAGSSREWLGAGVSRNPSVQSAWTAYSSQWLGGNSNKTPSVHSAWTAYSDRSWGSMSRTYETRVRDEELGFGVAI